MFSWKHGSSVCMIVAVLAAAHFAFAADEQPPSVLPDRPATSADGVDLGVPFESVAEGIELRPPANSKVLRRQGVSDLIAEFIEDKHNWLIRVSRTEVPLAKPLGTFKGDGDREETGALEDTADEFARLNNGAKQLRKEIVRINDMETGLLAFRFTQGTQEGMSRRLMQEAMIPFRQNEKHQNISKFFYSIVMFSPARKDDNESKIDPDEKLAADTFQAILESVKLLDRDVIRKDQNDRLARTRQLLLTLQDSRQIQKVAIPEQWLRILRDGKDVGYSYVTESPNAHQDATNGTLITVASHTTPATGVVVDVLSRIYLSQDWRKESWTHAVSLQDPKLPNIQTSAELGFSDFHQKWYEDLANAKDPKHVPVTRQSARRMEVRTQTGRAVSRPYIVEDLRPWYLPLVARQMLPRLLPLKEPKTYMFDTYVSELQKVMVRYIDVEAPRQITFAGKRFVAVPVKDRVGLEGAATTYYMTIDGTYLGSETAVSDATGKASVYQVISTDAATIRQAWPNAKFIRPDEGDMPTMPKKNPAE